MCGVCMVDFLFWCGALVLLYLGGGICILYHKDKYNSCCCLFVVWFLYLLGDRLQSACGYWVNVTKYMSVVYPLYDIIIFIYYLYIYIYIYMCVIK